MVSFDGVTKVMKLSLGTRSVTAQELYSRWKDWVIAGNANYAPAFNTVGGDVLTSSLRSPVYYFLLNDWKVEPASEDHTLDVGVNLYGSGGSDPFNTPLGNFTVRINNQTSNAQIVTQTVGSGLSLEQQEELKSIYLSLLGGRSQNPTSGEIIVFEEDGTTPRHTLQAYKDGQEVTLFEATEIKPKEI